MPIPDEQLAYEHHLADHRRWGLLRDGTPDESHWRAKAAQMQYYCVHDALTHLFVETVALSERLARGVAFNHIRYGAGRRQKIICQSVRDLHSVAPPDRRKPMKQEEVDTASRALNDFYIHTLGLLDNYAHAVGSQLAGARFSALRPIKRTLFSQEFLDCCNSPALRSLVEPFRAWAERLKSLRNPVAHGIPLTVPPAVITSEARADHEAATEAHSAAFNNPPPIDAPDRADAYAGWAARVQELMNHIESIGEFQPWIAHDPRAEIVPIYPTVLDDAGMLIRMCRATNRLLAGPGQQTGDAQGA